MATTTNYGWTTPDDTALVKDGASAIRTLGSSVDTTTKNLNPETTLGDIAYRSSTANVNTRLGLGTAGQVLTVNSGATAPEWASASAGFVGCLAYASNLNVSITGGVATAINMANEEFDTHGFHSTSSNTSRITIPSGKGGKYLLTAQWDVSGQGGGDYFITFIAKNGTVLTGSNRGGCGNEGGNGFSGMTYSTIADLAAADYVEFKFQQSASNTLNFYLRFGATYLGA